VTFNSTATVSRALTPVIEDFRDAVTNIQADGPTAIWDALALARLQLLNYGGRYPDAKKRILVLTDGDDNESTQKAKDVCFNLQVSHILFFDNTAVF
jgi:Mg-chelatase subunit ChlD